MKVTAAFYVALAAGALLLGACAGPKPEHGAAKPVPGQTAQASLPAGALSDTAKDPQSAKVALLGTGAAVVPPGGVSYYMDQQEKKLRQQLPKSGVSVRRVGDSITLNLPGNLVFSSNAAEIAPSFQETLNALAQILKDFDKTIVNVTGHTDGQGSDQYNQGLSERRAGSVAQYLIGQGLVPQRFVVTGMGKTQPVANNNTPEGRTANRRVEIKLSPLTTS